MIKRCQVCGEEYETFDFHSYVYICPGCKPTGEKLSEKDLSDDESDDDEEISKEDISGFINAARNLDPKIVILLIMIAISLLLYQLGYIYGYNTAYHAQDDYYKEYMSYYCICRAEAFSLLLPTPRGNQPSYFPS